MSEEERISLKEYPKWLKKNHGFMGEQAEGNYYRSVTERVKVDFEASPFWKDLTKNLREHNDQYYVDRGYNLLTGLELPKLQTKPFETFILKTYRKNVIDNAQWPNEPKDGWIVPCNWFSRINDTVRTCLVVKYLDGVEFLSEKLDSTCKLHNVNCRVDYEAKEEGYYAAHVYARQNFEIPSKKWGTEKVAVDIEIQITTQLQEVIRQLLHKYYESRRSKPGSRLPTWQWDYRSDEFAANYLGHILHYVEGMIVEIREKQQKEKTT